MAVDGYGAGMTADVRARPARRTALWVGLGGVAVLLVVGAVGAYLLGSQVADPPQRPITATGDLRLAAGQYSRSGQACAGTGGYADIRGGTQVVVTDGSSKTVAVGELAPGRLHSFDNKTTECVFDFQATVPAGHDFYGVTIGKRGTVQYPAAQLVQPLRLTLS